MKFNYIIWNLQETIILHENFNMMISSEFLTTEFFKISELYIKLFDNNIKA
jgi:hypothetical protein